MAKKEIEVGDIVYYNRRGFSGVSMKVVKFREKKLYDRTVLQAYCETTPPWVLTGDWYAVSTLTHTPNLGGQPESEEASMTESTYELRPVLYQEKWDPAPDRVAMEIIGHSPCGKSFSVGVAVYEHGNPNPGIWFMGTLGVSGVEKVAHLVKKFQEDRLRAPCDFRKQLELAYAKRNEIEREHYAKWNREPPAPPAKWWRPEITIAGIGDEDDYFKGTGYMLAEQCEIYISRDKELIGVACDEDANKKVVGAVFSSFDWGSPVKAYIDVVVADGYRRMGIGKELVQHAIDYWGNLYDVVYDGFNLYMDCVSGPGIRLAQSMGFTEVKGSGRNLFVREF